MITIGGKPKSIGVALSGGGYRAAAFHLGALSKLESLGLLDKVDYFSCVSGGSIVGAFLCKYWKTKDWQSRLGEKLKSSTIDVSGILKGLLNIFKGRTEILAQTYAEVFFDGTKPQIKDLAFGPRLYLNTTNLGTGNNFFFVTGGNRETGFGEWELGFHTADFSLCQAIAASSAFPPAFNPLVLDSSVYPNVKLGRVSLTDGGVYDNLGIYPLMNRKRNPVDYLIVSDGGKPFELDSNPTDSSLWTLRVSLDIMAEQIRGLGFYRLVESFRLGEGPQPLWFSIDSNDGAVKPTDAAAASRVSTRLSRLSTEEFDVLVRHGGSLLEARIKKYAPGLITT